ncbi:hypothetical protein ANN_26180 [Periplaneta americana]|uniref:Aminopeptidase N n=1 Tax=Periplaneta americana TaxID=6978 RepID=A0ABQ8S575_PERAM|nr:hypothetical protein ANN_26180 [Periplaneta americana]
MGSLCVAVLAVCVAVSRSAVHRRSIDTTEARIHLDDYRLPQAVVPTGYHLELIPYPGEGHFRGHVHINVTCLEATHNVVLHASEHLRVVHQQVSMRRIRAPGRAPASGLYDSNSITMSEVEGPLPISSITREAHKERFYITLLEELEKGAVYQVDLEFYGALDSDTSEGFFRGSYTNEHTLKQSWYAATKMAPSNARRIFPCFDEPSFKAPFRVSIARYTSLSTLSNMPLQSIEITDEQGWVWDHFPLTPPISTFSVGFLVSDLKSHVPFTMPNPHGGVAVHFHGRPQFLAGVEGSLRSATHMMEFLEDYLGVRYPLPKLDIVALPEYSGRRPADHLGLIMFREAELGDAAGQSRLVHELVYQWLSHVVTPHWWSDLHITNALGRYLATAGLLQLLDKENWAPLLQHSSYYEFSSLSPYYSTPDFRHDSVTNRERDALQNGYSGRDVLQNEYRIQKEMLFRMGTQEGMFFRMSTQEEMLFSVSTQEGILFRMSIHEEKLFRVRTQEEMLFRVGTQEEMLFRMSNSESDALQSAYSGRDALRNEYSGSDALQNAYSGRDALQNEYSGRDALRNEYSGSDALQSAYSGRDALQNEYSGRDALRNEYSGSDALQSAYSGRDALQNEYSGSDALQNAYSGRDALQNAYSGRDALQSAYSGRDALQNEYSGSDALQSAYSGRDALQNEYSGSDALQNVYSGRDALQNEYSGSDALQNAYSGRDALQNEYSGSGALQSAYSGRDAFQNEYSERDALQSVYSEGILFRMSTSTQGDALQRGYSGRDAFQNEYSGRGAFQNEYSGRDTLQGGYSGRDALQSGYSERDSLRDEYSQEEKLNEYGTHEALFFRVSTQKGMLFRFRKGCSPMCVLRNNIPQSQYSGNVLQSTLERVAFQSQWFLRMLNASLTEQTFRTALRNFLLNNQYSTFTEDEFWATLTHQAHMDGVLPSDLSVGQIARSWLRKDCHRFPVLTVQRDYNDNSAMLEQHVFIREQPRTLSEEEQYLTWYIPIAYLTPDNLNPSTAYPVAWMRGERYLNMSGLPDDQSFIIVNPTDSGMFMVNYDHHNWGLLAQHLQGTRSSVPAPARIKLLHDAWNLALGGELDFSTALDMTLFLLNETEPAVWDVMFTMIEHTGQHIRRTRVEDKYNEYLRRLMTPMYESLGEPTPDENPLRAEFWFNAKCEICGTGYEPCIEAAREALSSVMPTLQPEGNDTDCAAQQLNASQSTHRFSFVNHTIKTCAVSSTQKFLVQQHITTSKHQANKQLNSKQRQLFLTQPTTSNVRSEFNIDLCRSLISADIPLYKLKNKVFREFLEKYTQHTIPDESTLRKTYAPSIYDETIQKIRDEIKDSSIWVSIDETPDKEGRLVGNVVIGLLSEQYSERILLHCDVLEKCNNKTIVKLFNEAMGILWPKGIMYDNVLFFISDAAPYMVKAGQALSVVYPKLTHFTCVAHAFHRVAEVVRDNFLKPIFCVDIMWNSTEDWVMPAQQLIQFLANRSNPERRYLLKQMESCPDYEDMVQRILNGTLEEGNTTMLDGDWQMLTNLIVGSRTGQTMLFNFLSSNFEELKERFEDRPDTWHYLLTAAIRNFKTQADLDLVSEFYARFSRKLGTAVSVVEEAMKDINEELAWGRAHLPAIEYWLDLMLPHFDNITD